MPTITNLAPLTELEAINSMLSAIGESPVESIDTSNATVDMALNHLYDTTREMLSEGWKFNQEWGLALEPDGQLTWTDPDGTVVDLNVFAPPANLCRWALSRTAEQADLDITLRAPKEYAGALQDDVVFYDRTRNRDGLPSADFDLLYIDAVWFVDFEQLPDSARRYVQVAAMRRLILDVLGDSPKYQLKKDDEMKALRALKRDQGDEDDYSILNSQDALEFFGGRIPVSGTGLDLRNDP